MSVSLERLESRIHEYLTKILDDIFKTKEVGYITVSEVRLTKDLSIATIYYTILKDDKNIKEETTKLLAGYKGQIKKELAAKMKDIRKFPDITFLYDESLEYGNKIESILESIKDNYKWLLIF